jgi:hypothetical protein
MAPAWVAKDRKFFEKHGLDVQLILVNSGSLVAPMFSARNLRLPKVEAAEDFYLEALEELDRKPYPSLDGMRIVIKYVAEQNPKAAGINGEEIVDTSWLRKLDAEGIFEMLYGGK